MRSGCRVRQGGLGPTPCRHGGVIFDDNHRGLGPLRRSLGQRPEKKEVQIEASQIQDKNSKIEELQEHQISLLFFLLVGAERGKIEVRLPSGAARWRSRIPCSLGGGGGGGPGRSRSSCRCCVGHSRDNIACRGRACRSAWRLLTRLPPRREKQQEQNRWSGKTPLQLPQQREMLPRQQCLLRWSVSHGAAAVDSSAAPLRPRPCGDAFLVGMEALLAASYLKMRRKRS